MADIIKQSNEDVSAIDFSEPKFWYPSGLQVLDRILGNGGLASGRITEIYGPNRTAKSELSQKFVFEFLTRFPDGIVLYFDQEQALDSKKLVHIKEAGGDRFQPMFAVSAEKLFATLEKMLKFINDSNPNVPILIVVDSLAALRTEAEIDGQLTDLHIAPIARVMSRAFPRIKPILQATAAHLIIINQIRHKPGQQAHQDDESPGGEALKFWADYRIKTQNFGQYQFSKPKAGEAKTPPDGILIGYKTIKNKMAPPLRQCQVPVLFNAVGEPMSGLSDVWSVYDLLKKTTGDIKVAGGKSFLTLRDETGKNIGKLEDSFDRFEWPMIYGNPQHRVSVGNCLDRWTRAIMGSTVKSEDSESDAELVIDED